MEYRVLPVFSKVDGSGLSFFIPCRESLSVNHLIGGAFSEWVNGETSGAASKMLVDGLTVSFLAGGEYGVTGNVPCLMHTIRGFNEELSAHLSGKLDRDSFERSGTIISSFTKALASSWRAAGAIRNAIDPPRIFQLVLRNRLALYGRPPLALEEAFELATLAQKLNVDSNLLSDLHKALELAAQKRSVALSDDFVEYMLPQLHEELGKRELIRAGFSRDSAKQLVRQKSVHSLTPFYLKVREAVATWEAISSLVGVTATVDTAGDEPVCGEVRLSGRLRWDMYMGGALGSVRVNRVRIDSSNVNDALRRAVAKDLMSASESSAYFSSLRSLYDRAIEVALESDGVVINEGSLVSLCFGDAVTARSVLKRCQRIFSPPLSLVGVGVADYPISSASLPNVIFDECDVFGGIYGDKTTLGVVRDAPVHHNSPITQDKSGGLDLLTELSPGVVGRSEQDPWGDFEQGSHGREENAVSSLSLEAFTDEDPWGDLGDEKSSEISDLASQPFFLAPSPESSKLAVESSGSLGVTSDALVEVFASHIVFREDSGMLSFGIISGDSLVDYHSYNDHGDELSAYVSFINDKYATGFAPRSDKRSGLPSGRSSGLCHETIKLALGLCEQQR